MKDTAKTILIGIANATAHVLDAPLDIVRLSIEQNSSMFAKLQAPKVEKEKVHSEFSHPGLLAKCKINCSNGHNGLEMRKVGTRDDFKIIIRCAKLEIQKIRNNGVKFQKKICA